jgi:DNA-binding CsgD family transcriptional regulator
MILRFLKEGKNYRELAWIFDRNEDTIRMKIKNLNKKTK